MRVSETPWVKWANHFFCRRGHRTQTFPWPHTATGCKAGDTLAFCVVSNCSPIWCRQEERRYSITRPNVVKVSPTYVFKCPTLRGRVTGAYSKWLPKEVKFKNQGCPWQNTVLNVVLLCYIGSRVLHRCLQLQKHRMSGKQIMLSI